VKTSEVFESLLCGPDGTPTIGNEEEKKMLQDAINQVKFMESGSRAHIRVEAPKTIKSVALDFPNCTDGDCVYYLVGKVSYGNTKPVSRIESYQDSPESPRYFRIFTDDGLIAEMHQYGHIQYFE
jgi:hypothetical protein